MAAIETLMHEHRIIEKVLDAMDREAGKVLRGEPASVKLMEDAADFVRNFADRCHHAKEEAILFSEMAARGVAREGGPIGVMVAEHEGGRLYINRAREALAAGDLRKTAGCLAGYTSLLRRHIQKEDNTLYVIAKQVLTTSELDKMSEEFERVEAEEMGEGTHERYHEMAHRMAAGEGY